jgi:hypothetical protein
LPGGWTAQHFDAWARRSAPILWLRRDWSTRFDFMN